MSQAELLLSAGQLRPQRGQGPHRQARIEVGDGTDDVRQGDEVAERRPALVVDEHHGELFRRIRERERGHPGLQKLALPGARGARHDGVRPVPGDVEREGTVAVATEDDARPLRCESPRCPQLIDARHVDDVREAHRGRESARGDIADPAQRGERPCDPLGHGDIERVGVDRELGAPVDAEDRAVVVSDEDCAAAVGKEPLVPVDAHEPQPQLGAADEQVCHGLATHQAPGAEQYDEGVAGHLTLPGGAVGRRPVQRRGELADDGVDGVVPPGGRHRTVRPPAVRQPARPPDVLLVGVRREQDDAELVRAVQHGQLSEYPVERIGPSARPRRAPEHRGCRVPPRQVRGAGRDPSSRRAAPR